MARAPGRKAPPDQRRKLERKVKKRAVAFRRWLGKHPPRHAAAALLGLGGPCLDDWTRRWKTGRRQTEIRGRPTSQASSEAFAKAAGVFDDLGPAASVTTLMGLCPELGRNEAVKLLEELRRQCREDHYATVTALQWKRPGTVWAMDHTRSPGAIDDIHPHVLIVRDLAGQFQVGAMPQTVPTGRAVADALVDLFERHGAPLALKFDNHGAFTGQEVREVLERYGVLPLISPPYLPRYNGAVEAGAGQFKTRAHFLAARMNHPERWTADIVEGARIMANRTLRPWGKDGPTPEERWRERQLVSDQERADLRRAYELRLAAYQRGPPPWSADEGGAFFRVSRRPSVDGQAIGGNKAENAMPPWARKWNAAPGHRPRTPARPPREAAKRWAKKRENPQQTTGQRRESMVQCQRIRRRSLTDALVESGLLIIRKRRIPLPIKLLKRLKISGE